MFCMLCLPLQLSSSEHRKLFHYHKERLQHAISHGHQSLFKPVENDAIYTACFGPRSVIGKSSNSEHCESFADTSKIGIHIEKAQENILKKYSDLCKFNTAHNESQILHQGRVHSESQEKRFQCNICGSTSKSSASLKLHEKSHSDKRPYHCHWCNYGANYSKSLNNHIEIMHSAERKFECSVCTKRFQSAGHLAEHMKTHSDEKPYACSMCDYKAKHVGSVNHHERTVHSTERPFKCDECLKTFKSSQCLSMHKKRHANARLYPCSQCDYRSNTGQGLNKHVKNHSENSRPFHCSLCPSQFKSSTKLRYHIERHGNEKTYSCNLCDFRANNIRYVVSHKKQVHSKERPFLCELCEKRFKTRSDWRKHLKIHSGEKKFACSLCEYMSIQSGSLRSHMKMVHSNEHPFQCSLCTKKFKTKGNMKNHIKAVHEKNNNYNVVDA